MERIALYKNQDGYYYWQRQTEQGDIPLEAPPIGFGDGNFRKDAIKRESLKSDENNLKKKKTDFYVHCILYLVKT